MTLLGFWKSQYQYTKFIIYKQNNCRKTQMQWHGRPNNQGNSTRSRKRQQIILIPTLYSRNSLIFDIGYRLHKKSCIIEDVSRTLMKTHK